MKQQTVTSLTLCMPIVKQINIPFPLFRKHFINVYCEHKLLEIESFSPVAHGNNINLSNIYNKHVSVVSLTCPYIVLCVKFNSFIMNV